MRQGASNGAAPPNRDERSQAVRKRDGAAAGRDGTRSARGAVAHADPALEGEAQQIESPSPDAPATSLECLSRPGPGAIAAAVSNRGLPLLSDRGSEIARESRTTWLDLGEWSHASLGP